ncbi:MAG: SDR family NAD(P)-dependent oxidoreductase [Chloroflexi bacterium]|nr:SDR family NAD(P)-dependent oxidoreductase [Chloroflexota bacterium]
MLANVVDAVLELSIVGSFSRIGYAVRRRLHAWSDPVPGSLDGQTALVTGPTSGLGRQAVDELAALGARVILVGRSPDKLAAVADELTERHGEDRFPTVEADLGSLDSIRSAVEQILASEERLDALVDNAGAIFPERHEGPDGIEATLALLVVGPFALTAGLLPLLRRTPGARVVAVTSGGMYTQPLDLDDLQLTSTSYAGPKAYARSKRAQVTLIREWARRADGLGVRFNAMHPGWADTPGLAEMLPGFHRFMGPVLRSATEGIDTLVWLVATPDAGIDDGRLWLDRRPRPFDRIPSTRLTAAERRRLWREIVDLAGVEDPLPEPEARPSA